MGFTAHKNVLPAKYFQTTVSLSFIAGTDPEINERR